MGGTAAGSGGDEYECTEEVGVRASDLTFVFTSHENMARLVERLGSERYRAVFDKHQRAVQQALSEFGGLEVERDAGFVAFSDPAAALNAAGRVVQSVESHEDVNVAALGIRIGIHFGNALRIRDEFVGLEVNRAASICAVANSGQVVLSEAVVKAVSSETQSWQFKDLGRHRLKDLSEPQRLFQLVVDGVENDFPSLKSLEAFPTNLPVQLTPFVGRATEVRQVRELIRNENIRLLSLLGPGGVGKTRLALQVAGSTVQGFADGVFFVELAPLSISASVLPEIAQVLDIRERPGQSLEQSIVDDLWDKHLLLVIDNFEHLLDAAPALNRILDQCKQVKALVTTRSPLRVKGEQLYDLAPLAVPEPTQLLDLTALAAYDSIALFVDRAHAVRPGFALTGSNSALVVGICQRVDGVPLAIELAAARIKLFSPRALFERLDKRLALLKSSARDLPERQSTLRSTIGWSYTLLTPQQQALLASLSVFSGGCTLEAIAMICDPERKLDASKNIEELSANNLTRIRDDPQLGPRVLLLELIREFAAEKLDDTTYSVALHDRHAEFYALLAERAGPKMHSAGAPEWVALMKAEQNNLDKALEWLLEHDESELALRLLSGSWVYHSKHGHGSEILLALDRALAGAPETDPKLLAASLFAASMLSMKVSRPGSGRRYLEELQELTQRYSGVLDEGRVQFVIGVARSLEGNFTVAIENFKQSSKLAFEVGDDLILGTALSNLGACYRHVGNSTKAMQVFRRTLALAQESQDDDRIASALVNIGWTAVQLHDYQLARSHLIAGADAALKLGLDDQVRYTLIGLALILLDNEPQIAIQLLGCSEKVRRQLELSFQPREEEIIERAVGKLRGALDLTQFELGWDAGMVISLSEAVALAKTATQAAIPPSS